MYIHKDDVSIDYKVFLKKKKIIIIIKENIINTIFF